MTSGCSSSGCCAPPGDSKSGPRFRRVLWIALVINAGMFVMEFGAAWRAGSVSLLADAIDFFGDAGNYAVSLFVLGLAPIWRSRSALVKGVTMGLYSFFVLGQGIWALQLGTIPNALTMGWVGFAALIANVSVALMLYTYREGDANMRSVWLCSRNDAIGNVAVMLAALGVFGTGTAWPDLAVALMMSVLGLLAAVSVIRQSVAEIRQAKRPVTGRTAPVSAETP